MPKWGGVCFWPKGRRNIKMNGLGNEAPTDNTPFSFANKPNDTQTVTSIVELIRKDGEGLGLIISGGADKDFNPIITSLKPGSLAYRCDALDIGDAIISVNGIRVLSLKHEEIINMLKNAEGHVVLEIEFPVPSFLLKSKNLDTTSRIIQIKLEKEDSSFGMVLRSGVDKNRLVVTNLRPGGPAEKEGTLKVGDRVIAIDHCNLNVSHHQDAFAYLQHIEEEALFTIQYQVSKLELVRNASGPLSVEIDKSGGSQLGISLSQAVDSSLIIESIKQGSIAERCGAIHVGDHILAIDQKSTENLNPSQAMQILKSNPNPLLKLEILPVSQMVFRQPSDTMIKKASHTKHHKPNISNSNWNHSTLGRMASLSRTETVEVILHSERGAGFGFCVQPCPFGFVISELEPGGSAEVTGIIQIGDRLIKLNRRPTQLMEIQDIEAILNQSKSSLTLFLEFDIVDSVVLNSGTFQVKLPCLSANMGLTIRETKHREPGEPLLISAIDRGSPAHRSGTIQPGDRLLAIDNISLDSCLVEQALEILHTADSIVTLTILKEDFIPEREDCINIVKLVHNGNPLGITIAGTEDINEPILISNITDGGLAQREEGIHIGDHVMEINRESVKGKSLQDIITMIQSSGNSVTLKLFSPGSSPLLFNKLDPTLPSVDSAVESWGSSALELSFSTQNGGATSRRIEEDGSCHSGDWSSVMEDLETFGNSHLLRHIERTIDPVEVHHVTLFKDQVYEDFGFSVSDSLYDKGVYINRIRPGGPADLSGMLRPLDRILHVNNTRTHDYDCCLTVPLIAAAGDKIELVVSRSAYHTKHL